MEAYYTCSYIAALHSRATPLLRGFSRKNIFCQKIFDNFFSFQATEIVLTSKWGRIQPEIQIWHVQVVAASWTLVRSPKHAEKMLIQLITPTAPSWPAVQWTMEVFYMWQLSLPILQKKTFKDWDWEYILHSLIILKWPYEHYNYNLTSLTLQF